MIETPQDLEAAVSEAIELVDGRNRLDPASDARLGQLVRSIKDSTPSSGSEVRGRLDALTADLDAFQKRWAREHPTTDSHWLNAEGCVFPG